MKKKFYLVSAKRKIPGAVQSGSDITGDISANHKCTYSQQFSFLKLQQFLLFRSMQLLRLASGLLEGEPPRLSAGLLAQADVRMFYLEDA